MTLPEAIKMLEQTDETAEHKSKGKRTRLVIMIKKPSAQNLF